MINSDTEPVVTSGKRHKARGRRRVQEVFWLNARNPREQALGRALEAKKEQRLYSATIRDGVELLLTLEQGDVGFLLSRFPNTPRLLRQHFIGGE